MRARGWGMTWDADSPTEYSVMQRATWSSKIEIHGRIQEFVRVKQFETSVSRSAQHVFATVLLLLDQHGPARELVGGLPVSGVHQESEGFHQIGPLLRVEGDKTETAALFVGFFVPVGGLADLGISDRVHVHLVA